MADSLLDDVKALLDKDFGDDRILKQICRACEHNEIISNYERNYVKQLAEKHLGRRPEFISPSSLPVEEKPAIPDVRIPIVTSRAQTPIIQTKTSRQTYSRLKNKKVMFGIAGIALVVILAVGISLSGITGEIPNNNNNTGNGNPTAPPVAAASLSVQTDLAVYDNQDLISISGVSSISGDVNLSIENQDAEIVWTEQVSTKSDGRFSTLAIAGGLGWENSGTYTIKADNGGDTKSNTFSFTA